MPKGRPVWWCIKFGSRVMPWTARISRDHAWAAIILDRNQCQKDLRKLGFRCARVEFQEVKP